MLAGLVEACARRRHRTDDGGRGRDAGGVEAAQDDAVTVLGSVDAQKLKSSMTLFAQTVPDEAVFQEVLDQYFAGKADAATTSRLNWGAATG